MSRTALKMIDVRRKPGHRSRGQLIAGQMVLHCALGKGGITAFKREGDGERHWRACGCSMASNARTNG